MAEHFCTEHKQPWFKTPYGYSHPIVDNEGNPVLNDKGKQKWCKEPDSEQAKPTGKKSADDSPEKIASIEAQTAYNGVPQLVELLVKYPNHPLAMIAEVWATSKLGGRVTSIPQAPQAAKKAVEGVSSSPVPTETGEGDKPPTTVRELMTWWSGHGKTYTPSSARKILGLNDKSPITNIGEAYEVLNDSLSLVNEAKRLGATEIES